MGHTVCNLEIFMHAGFIRAFSELLVDMCDVLQPRPWVLAIPVDADSVPWWLGGRSGTNNGAKWTKPAAYTRLRLDALRCSELTGGMRLQYALLGGGVSEDACMTNSANGLDRAYLFHDFSRFQLTRTVSSNAKTRAYVRTFAKTR